MASAKMISDKQGLQIASLRSLFDKPAPEAPPPVDESRRVTLRAKLAGYHKSSGYSSRVEKHPANSRKRRSRGSPDLAQQFEGAIADTKEELQRRVEQLLTEIETEATGKLEEVIADFEEKLQIAIDYEARAFQSVAEERLLITLESQKDGVVEKREVIFGDRILEFMETAEEEERILDGLWRQWVETQLEMICLAMEVLGPDEIAIDDGKMAANLQEKLESAFQIHTQHKNAYSESLERLAAIKESAKKTSARTLKTLKEQQKVWVAATKSTIEQVTNALQVLSET